ncbi:MAG: RadC family protein [Deltaproteobacteria bacterium]|nr:RadC family protein [Deltaproteobacteria bacterium]
MTITSSKAGHRKRLKGKYINTSLEGFHDYEVLELLLTFAIPRRDVKPLAKELLGRFKGLKGVFEAKYEDLSCIPGIGDNTAILLILLKEIAGAYLLEQMIGRHPVRSAKDVFDFLELTFKGEASEKFLALYLNTKNEILGVETIHEGGIDRASISPKKVIEKAFKYNARSIIFVHNTPGEKITPKGLEKHLVKELESSAEAIDIIVHDYLITGSSSHISARELGWLKGSNS